MKKSQLIQLIKEVISESLNEYEGNEIIPGIRKNDEGEYDVSSGMALDYYEKYAKKSTTIGTLVSALKAKLKAYNVELPDSEVIKIAYAIDEKGSRNKSNKRY